MTSVKKTSNKPSGLGEYLKTGGPGRPKGSKNRFGFEAFAEALATVEEQKQKSLYQHIIERAFEDDRILAALIARIVPAVEVVRQEDEELKETELSFTEVPIKNGQLPENLSRFLN